MHTSELINGLSQAPSRPSIFGPAAAVIGAAIVALALAIILSAVWLNPRDDLAIALVVSNHVFLLKVSFTLGVAVSALPIVRDLSVPGRRLGSWSLLAAVPFVVIGILALKESFQPHVVGPSHHGDAASWLECLWQIPALSIPAFLILTIVVRRLAPTNLTLTGAYLGLAAGGIGAVGYSFHCGHDSLAFIAAFYTLAIFEMAMLGALIGPRVLRWTVSRRH